MRGRFILNGIPLWNTVPQEGQKIFQEHLWNQVVTDFPTTLYVGLCDQGVSNTITLGDITTEPGAAGGYARLPLVRNATDWPTITLENGYYVARSKQLVWTPSGADFDSPISRAFLTNVASGSAGHILSISGALAESTTIVDGTPFTAEYEFYIVSP